MTFLGEIIEFYLQQNFLENLMPTLNKETKKESLMLMMQLITKQHFFVV